LGSDAHEYVVWRWAAAGTVIGGAESAGTLASHLVKPATPALTAAAPRTRPGSKNIEISSCEPQALSWVRDRLFLAAHEGFPNL